MFWFPKRESNPEVLDRPESDMFTMEHAWQALLRVLPELVGSEDRASAKHTLLTMVRMVDIGVLDAAARG